MNLDQILSLIRTLLAAGGPVAGLLTLYGFPQDKTAMWLGLGLVILPPIASALWGIIAKTDAAKVASVGAMPGVTVSVGPDASLGAQAAALNKDVPGVNPAVVVPPAPPKAIP